MKIISTSLLALASILFSCSSDSDKENEPQNCYRCYITTEVKTSNAGSESKSTQFHCDLTPEHVSQLEAEGTSSTTKDGVTTSITTKCEMK